MVLLRGGCCSSVSAPVGHFLSFPAPFFWSFLAPIRLVSGGRVRGSGVKLCQGRFGNRGVFVV